MRSLKTVMTPILSIVGKSQSGKTTLIEKLIPVLRGRGYRIGIIKHAHHGFDIDQEGKDSWRHKEAGADTVIVAGPEKIAMIKNDNGNSLNDLEKYVQDLDLVITEGYKRENRPKIEVIRAARNSTSLCVGDPALFAVLTDTSTDCNVPRFELDDVKGLADLIERKFLQK